MSGSKRPRKGQLPPGVKGPAARRDHVPSASSASSASQKAAGSPRGNLERASIPILKRLLSVPRWLIVVAMGTFLFLGLIQTGDLAWLGGIFLVLVGLFLGWLLALSWPVLTPGRRGVRVVVVAAVLGIAVLKFLGRF